MLPATGQNGIGPNSATDIRFDGPLEPTTRRAPHCANAFRSVLEGYPQCHPVELKGDLEPRLVTVTDVPQTDSEHTNSTGRQPHGEPPSVVMRGGETAGQRRSGRGRGQNLRRSLPAPGPAPRKAPPPPSGQQVLGDVDDVSQPIEVDAADGGSARATYDERRIPRDR